MCLGVVELHKIDSYIWEIQAGEAGAISKKMINSWLLTEACDDAFRYQKENEGFYAFYPLK